MWRRRWRMWRLVRLRLLPLRLHRHLRLSHRRPPPLHRRRPPLFSAASPTCPLLHGRTARRCKGWMVHASPSLCYPSPMRSFSRYATSSPLRLHPSASSSAIHGHHLTNQHYRRQQNVPPPPPPALDAALDAQARRPARAELDAALGLDATYVSLFWFDTLFTLRVCFTLHGRATSFVVLHLILPTYTLMCPTQELALEPHLRPLIYISPRTCSRIYPHPHDCLDTSPLCSRGLEDAVLVAVYFSSAMNDDDEHEVRVRVW